MTKLVNLKLDEIAVGEGVMHACRECEEAKQERLEDGDPHIPRLYRTLFTTMVGSVGGAPSTFSSYLLNEDKELCCLRDS